LVIYSILIELTSRESIVEVDGGSRSIVHDVIEDSVMAGQGLEEERRLWGTGRTRKKEEGMIEVVGRDKEEGRREDRGGREGQGRRKEG
jgi:hypothetical protein